MQRTKRGLDVKSLTTMGLLSAMAVVVMLLFRIPIIPAASFLTLDFKDVIIGIGALVYGPVAGFLMALVVSLIEMFTVSGTQLWGLLMNVLATASFICPAAILYRRRRTARAALVGLLGGVLLMTAMMLLWNYLITPIYTGWPRADVAGMLVSVFLPFNLVKGGINAALIMFLYKPIISAMRRAGVVGESTQQQEKGKLNLGIVLAALVILASCVVFVLVQWGIL